MLRAGWRLLSTPSRPLPGGWTLHRSDKTHSSILILSPVNHSSSLHCLYPFSASLVLAHCEASGVVISVKALGYKHMRIKETAKCLKYSIRSFTLLKLSCGVLVQMYAAYFIRRELSHICAFIRPGWLILTAAQRGKRTSERYLQRPNALLICVKTPKRGMTSCAPSARSQDSPPDSWSYANSMISPSLTNA